MHKHEQLTSAFKLVASALRGRSSNKQWKTAYAAAGAIGPYRGTSPADMLMQGIDPFAVLTRTCHVAVRMRRLWWSNKSVGLIKINRSNFFTTAERTAITPDGVIAWHFGAPQFKEAHWGTRSPDNQPVIDVRKMDPDLLCLGHNGI